MFVQIKRMFPELGHSIFHKTAYVPRKDSDQPAHLHRLISLACQLENTMNPWLPKNALQRLTLHLLNTTCPVLANSVDPDQLASEEANWSESVLFVIKYMNFYQKLIK